MPLCADLVRDTMGVFHMEHPQPTIEKRNMPFVYSTLSSPQEYCLYSKSVVDGAPPQVTASVYIEGGANVANKNFITPFGVVTNITDEQEKILLQCEAFKEHVSRGFVRVEKKKAEEIEQVTSGMTSRDDSAPLTEQDIESSGEAKVLKSKKGGK